ncbi:MAG TPA: Rne/Rng family ribonuclease [Candidatus Limnocylindria bacterium]|nr:Rne/Rng family ribonuclease [Candidatus Limnocylindria bacterium]
MSKHILINVAPWEVRVALLERTTLVELHCERRGDRGIAGNLYKGRVTRVLPGMQAAFVDIGLEKAAFLHVSDLGGGEPPPALVADEDGADGEAVPPAPGPSRPTGAPIQDRLTKGEELLVQVAKEPIGTKGARVTTHVSLPGRYLVFTPGSTHVGISRRIEDPAERERLHAICTEERPAEGGLIVRTACEGATKREIRQDVRYLSRLWARVRRIAEETQAPALVHADLDLALRVVRDSFTADVERLTIDRAPDHARVLEFVREFMPRLASRVHLYQGATPLFDQYGIETKINRALERRVWLKSGGYLIFDQTESLTTVDVNTGRYVGKTDQQETIVRTNLEAAEAVVQQLRLRNIGGIIVIDFIDMDDPADRARVLDALQEAARRDRARTNVHRISELGLVQMTRKRTRESLEQALTTPCPHCHGIGRVRSCETLAYAALRGLQREVALRPGGPATLRVHPDVAAFLLNEGRAALAGAEEMLGCKITIAADPDCAREEHSVAFDA